MEALAIVKSVKWITDSLFEFAQLRERYIYLSERLCDLADNLYACEITLRMWNIKWGVKDRQPVKYYEYLWSKAGWRRIRRCLSAIDAAVALVKQEVDAVIGTALRYQGHSRQRSYSPKHDGAAIKRALDRIGKRMSRVRRFAWAVTLKADSLDTRLRVLEKRLVNLEIFADDYLYATFPELYGKDPKALRNGIQRIGQDREREAAMTVVRRSRESAKSLHEAYKGCEGLECHIGVANSVNYQPNSILRLESDFRFVLSDGSQSAEFLAKQNRVDGGNNASSRTMDVAFRNIMLSSTPAAALLPPGALNGVGFDFHRCSTLELAHLNQIEPLSSLLLNNSRNDFTPAIATPVKFRIAASLIEGLYRFLGTPWLNYLDTANIRGECPGKGSDWRAMIRCEVGNKFVNRTLAQVTSQKGNRTRDLTTHSHIFGLGLVLTELALGSRVTYIEASEDNGAPGIMIVMPELAQDEKLDVEEIAAEVEERTSETYADLVRFCFSVLQKRAMIARLDIDSKYEAHLLYPAKTMSQLVA